MLGFLQVLLQIGHERGSAGTDSGGIAYVRLMLPVNVTISIPNVDFAELGEEIDAGAIGGPEFRTTELPISHIAGEQRTTQVVVGLFEAQKKRTVARRHIVTHFMQIDGQRIRSMTDAETGIEAGYDGTLGTSFASKLVRLSRVS